MADLKALSNQIELDVALGNLSAAQAFTKMRDLLNLALSHAAGQEGEQCRAASGEPRRLDVYVGSDGWKARPLEERLRIHAEDCERCADERTDAVLSAFQIRAMHDDLHEAIRALSRVVPEGNAVIPWRDEIDRMYVEGWAQSLRRIKDYRAYFIEHGYHPEYVAVRLERLLAAIAAQRKEGE